MSLTVGAKLGPYEILSALGAGGMGEVYRAKDTRLDRLVAIKVLPAGTALDPDARARFEREAKLISQLQHPHICTLYDIGEALPTAERAPGGSVPYLVMEYLEGETLAARIKKGPLPVENTLKYAIQIGDALDKAHRQGIIHRDLKPGNLMLTKAGAMLLDFGLGKLVPQPNLAIMETQAAPESRAASPASGGAPLTSQGTILGTLQYMAPEQIEGREADARADVWAFGAVLFEMLTGKRAFEGKTQVSVIGAILEREPPSVTDLQPLVPPALARVVRTCLAKDRDDRFQTAHDLLLQLRWIEEGGSAAGLATPVIARRKRRERGLWLGVASLAALTGATAVWFLKPDAQRASGVTRFTVPLPEGQAYTRTGRHVLAIAPDGSFVVYVANKQLYLRRMDQLDPQPIKGTAEDPLDPVVSPDGQWVAYFTASGVLEKIPVAGGSPTVLAPRVQPPFGQSWQDGTIVFGQGAGGILSVPDGGGTPSTIVATDQSKAEQVGQPQLLPGGRSIVFSVLSSNSIDSDIVVQSLETGGRRTLVQGGSDGHVLPAGYLIYVHEQTLFAAAFDLKREAIISRSAPLIVAVGIGAVSGAGQFTIALDGRLVYQPAPAVAVNGLRTLVWVDRQGHEQPIAAEPRPYVYPRISPDGTKIALDVVEKNRDVWIWDLKHDLSSRLSVEAAETDKRYPVWTPDGASLIYGSSSGAVRHSGMQVEGAALFRRAASGTGMPELLLEVKGVTGALLPESASPDGKTLVCMTLTPNGADDLLLLPLTGDRKPSNLIATKFDELNAAISPDGRWLAYQSNESGQHEVYVRPFPAVDSDRWQVSIAGGTRPAWSRSGRELYYIAADRRLMAVSIESGATFSYGRRPSPLFDATPYTSTVDGRPYDVAPDGRFVMIKGAQAGPITAGVKGFVVVDHLLEDLKARLKR